MIVTTAAGVAIPGSNGLRARVLRNDRCDRRARAQRYADRAFTRIDERLQFAPGERELPLNFFNDNSRFSFFQVRPRQRQLLEFSVRWSGLWWVPGGVGRDLRRCAAGDRRSVHRRRRRSKASVALTPGWHRLDVALSSPYGAPRRVFGRHHPRRRRGAVRFARGRDAADPRLADDGRRACCASCERSATSRRSRLIAGRLRDRGVEKDRRASPAGDRSRAAAIRRWRSLPPSRRSTRCASRGRGPRA